MAVTTTAVNGCDVALWLDDDASVAQDISGSSNKVDISLTQELGEYRVFQDHWTHRLCCGKDGNFTIQVIYSTTADEGWDIIKNWIFAADCETRTIHVYIPDKDVGSDYFSAEVHWDNVAWTADRGDAGPILVTISLPADGQVSHTTTAT